MDASPCSPQPRLRGRGSTEKPCAAGYLGSQRDVTRNSDYKWEIKLQLRHTSFSLSVCLLIYPRGECGFHHVIYFKLRLDALQETVGQVQVVWLVVGVTGCTLGTVKVCRAGGAACAPRPSCHKLDTGSWGCVAEVVVLHKPSRKHSQSLKVSSHLFNVSRALWWDQRDLRSSTSILLCACSVGEPSGWADRPATALGSWSVGRPTWGCGRSV